MIIKLKKKIFLNIFWYIIIKKKLPLEIVNAGDHCDLNISKHILPLLFIFGWYIRVVNAIFVFKKKN